MCAVASVTEIKIHSIHKSVYAISFNRESSEKQFHRLKRKRSFGKGKSMKLEFGYSMTSIQTSCLSYYGLSVCVSVCLDLSFCPFICLSVGFSVSLSVSVCSSICLFICLFVYLSVFYLSVCLSISSMSVCLSIYLTVQSDGKALKCSFFENFFLKLEQNDTWI